MRLLVTDWDETATIGDTTALIAAAAAATASTGEKPGEQQIPAQVPDFSYFSSIYQNAYSAYDQACSQDLLERNTIPKEREYQRGMRAVEMASITALEKTGYFKGSPASAYTSLASKVELDPLFVSFIKSRSKPIFVLSVNWSKRLIEATMDFHGVKNAVVIANDLEFDTNSIATGRFSTVFDVRTGLDKERELRRIKDMHPGHKLIYVGDGSGDVLPILCADVGILISGGRGRPYLERITEIRSLRQYNPFREDSSGDRLSTDPKPVYEGTWSDIDAVWNN